MTCLQTDGNDPRQKGTLMTQEGRCCWTDVLEQVKGVDPCAQVTLKEHRELLSECQTYDGFPPRSPNIGAHLSFAKMLILTGKPRTSIMQSLVELRSELRGDLKII